ncbi:hypothetical protein JET18_05145 [Chryseobacterium sp. L7]|uniref:Uncharacterized protein n=1 Tax=Chryseobacterium endalhagicum TaxID=2797638 RepID=A0ABS1QD52_9FLAO|nr:hypothetical protein [Chryseobacterium endalhagicum]MBL1220212.1 hypothetical protein [Chryseobacterium endalhagicum]
MVDNTKFIIYKQELINRLLKHPDFIECRPKTNNYDSLKHKDFGTKLSLDFRKVIKKGVLLGYRQLEINTSPHYHFNQYRHNGNDFTPENCIKTIIDILSYLGIDAVEYRELEVCNIEFGLNIIPEIDIKNLIDGLLLYKKTPFKIGDFQYFKKTDATTYKQIKAYAKGLQFVEIPKYGIDINTFRFEVKTKQAKKIKMYGILTADDLITPKNYPNLMQEIINEWDHILLINQRADFSKLNSADMEFVRNAEIFDFWGRLIIEKHRNTFSCNKVRYYKILQGKNNVHQRIKNQIIDKLYSFSKCADSTQQTSIKKGKDSFSKTQSPLINLESAQLNTCMVTGLDISMQRKNSFYLCLTGLRYYRENAPDQFELLERKYLTEKRKRLERDEKLYYIAHNIRNAYTNKVHNQKSFEKRNYSPNQLQFNFRT